MIRWKRFKAIAELVVCDVVKRPVSINLSLSTDLPDHVISAVSFTVNSSNPIDVIFNARRCKDEPAIIEALVHELAHVVVGSDEHGNEWEAGLSIVTGKFDVYNNSNKKYGRRNSKNVHDSSEKKRDRVTREENFGDYCDEE